VAAFQHTGVSGVQLGCPPVDLPTGPENSAHGPAASPHLKFSSWGKQRNCLQPVFTGRSLKRGNLDARVGRDLASKPAWVSLVGQE